MKTKAVYLLSGALLIVIGAWQFSQNSSIEPTSFSGKNAAIERGAYLVGIMGCNDCHTPLKMGPQGPEPDMTRMLSGHPEALVMPPPPFLGEGPWITVGSGTNTAYAGPWGVSYAANLTPDATGMKGWTEEMFVGSIKTGWHMGYENTRRVQPPMPWPAYRNATDEDLKAIYAYLQTVPPIRNVVPAYQPPRPG